MINYYKVGGSLNYNHPSYVVRQADRELYTYLKAGDYCFVLNSRQMGKSSLRVKVSRQLRDEGIQCAFLDLTLIGVHVNQSQWYKSLARQLLDSLELEEIQLNQFWEQYEGLTEVQRFQQLIELIFKEFSDHLIIFIDEIDSLISLSFKDDFLAFIRACYNQRVDNLAYKRLTFCLLGVASPGDLIQDKERTPFNIGYSVNLSGITFEEGKEALLNGLSDFQQPEKLLKEILFWTRGQPFLTQKLCYLVREKSENNNPNISQIVEKYIIDRWESQDQPEHLKTLRDRLLFNDQKSIRLLELYQQILSTQVLANESEEQITLRLTGLVVKRHQYLEVYNPIYRRIFNQDWITEQLDHRRPYYQALNQWVQSNRESIYLLQGQTLADALLWSKDKSLSSVDYQFLSASQAEQDRKANQILAEANQKAKQLIRRGGLILGITSIASVLIAIATTLYSQQQLKIQKKIIQLEKSGVDAQTEFDSKQLNALLSAIKVGQDLKTLSFPTQSLPQYPTIRPLATLLNILSQIQERNQLEGHTKGVKNVNFSPDGKLIVTGGVDGTLKIWQREGQLLKTLRHSEIDGSVDAVSFSPQGNLIVSGNREGTIKLWTVEGNLLRTSNHGEPVYSLTFSPDGNLLVSSGSNGVIKLWKSEGTLEKTINYKNSVYSLDFSPDGTIFVTGDNQGIITFWTREGTPVQKIQGHLAEINSIAFSSDGKLLASASGDTTIKLWNLQGQLIKTLTGHQDSVFSVVFNHDNSLIISGSLDKTIKLWTIEGQLQQTLLGHNDSIYSISLSPDSQMIASGSGDTTVKLWLLNQQETPQLMQQNAEVIEIAFSPDGKTFMAGSSTGQINQWTIESKLAKILVDQELLISRISFNLENQIIALGQLDGKITLVTSQGAIKTLSGHKSEVKSISIRSDGKRFISGDEEGTIKLWKPDGQMIKSITGHQGVITTLDFSPNGENFLSGSQNDKTLKLWRLDGTLLKTFTDDRLDGMTIANFSPDGKTFAVGSSKGLIMIGNQAGIFKDTLIDALDEITTLKFSPDGKIIAAGSRSGTVKLWAREGTLLLTLNRFNSSITSLSFSPDNQSLAVGNSNGTVMLWSLNLDQILEQGCQWIKDYWKTHASIQQTLPICQKI